MRVFFLQQVGRCMRPSPGKEEGLVLDNVGLWLEHGHLKERKNVNVVNL